MVSQLLHKIAIGSFILSSMGLCASLGVSWGYSDTLKNGNSGSPAYFVPCIARIVGFLLAATAMVSAVYLKQVFEKARFHCIFLWLASALGLAAIAIMDPAALAAFEADSTGMLKAIKYLAIIFSCSTLTSTIFTLATIHM
ncbi:hypothetical protein IWW48_005113 [Coemansia sp. RSA 1200]|nr:hypothetical protein IWW48_005113 [Coemansia sp. RSA 1200]